MMQNKFQYYGRYVDDFFIVCKNKDDILNFIPKIKNTLKEKLQIVLHPNKLYIQHYTKGIKFIGCVVKKDRTYISNTTISNIYNFINTYNPIANENLIDKFLSTMNSYFGFLKHHLTYSIKYKLVNMIDMSWSKYVKITNTLSKFSPVNEYNKLSVIKRLLCNKNYSIL